MQVKSAVTFIVAQNVVRKIVVSMEIMSERTVAKKFPYTNSQIVH